MKRVETSEPTQLYKIYKESVSDEGYDNETGGSSQVADGKSLQMAGQGKLAFCVWIDCSRDR
jgi:hypothetical protein